MASIGSIFAARRDGIYPDKMPITDEIPIPIRAFLKVSTSCSGNTRSARAKPGWAGSCRLRVGRPAGPPGHGWRPPARPAAPFGGAKRAELGGRQGCRAAERKVTGPRPHGDAGSSGPEKLPTSLEARGLEVGGGSALRLIPWCRVCGFCMSARARTERLGRPNRAKAGRARPFPVRR